MTKVCIIGVSGYAKIHYDFLVSAHAAGKVMAVGATIINQGEEAEKCATLNEIGCRIFEDYLEMLHELRGIADLCLIPTGTPLHRQMTVAALEAGMNVLVEKPVAGCLDDALAMQTAARKSGKLVALGYQHMYSPAALGTKRHIQNGTIGDLKSVKCMVTWPRDHDYYARNAWAGKLAVDGTQVNDSPFNNAVAHDLMMMLFQAGPSVLKAAEPVSVEANLFRANAIESADTACICVHTANGIPVRFYATHACCQNFGPEIHIHGTKGTIVMTHRESVIKPDGGETIILPTSGNGNVRDMMFNAVIDAIKGGIAFICELDTAIMQTQVIDAIHKNCTIQSLAGETETLENGKTRTFIPGIESVMKQAFDNERLFCGADISSAIEADVAVS